MPKVAVVGNVCRDVVDGAEPTPGGCPTFAAEAFRLLGQEGQIVTRFAPPDAALFERVIGIAGVLPAAATSGFEIEYDGEERSMRVTAAGERWRPADAAALAPDVEWVHVAPLLRSDFPSETLGALATGRRLSLDGQGLVRVPALGALREDASFEPALLEHVTALKLSEPEAEIVAGGRFDLDVAAWLGVPEVLLTLGSRGAVVFAEGRETLVETAPVEDVHSTGAGDVFMVAYAVSRVEGQGPVDAARAACRVVGELLRARRAERSAPGSVPSARQTRANVNYPN
jgi:sugar/nucleoside kinase (ribokinase family)